jgi:glycosyltransferase involved in cell wall biosynthesis
MRIGIDAHHLNGKPQGSRSHLVGLIRALSRISDDELWIYSFEPDETRKLLCSPALGHRRVFPESARARVPFVVPALQLIDRLDVFHSQYVAPPLSLVPDVVTIHDVLFETHPELFEGAFSRRSVHLIRRSARRARVVLTVSEFSRRALLDLYQLPEDKVRVTPNAVDPERFRPLGGAVDGVRERYRLDAPFLLSVGRLEPRKNLARLVRAFGRVRARLDPELRLVLVGTHDFRFRDVLEEVERQPEGTVRILGPVSDEDLPALYHLSEALVYPSLAEGFGLPVLEALACGTPVLSSPRGALPEVGGDAVLWVDPEDEDDLAAGIESIVTDRELREALRRRGLEQARLFDWERTAKGTLEAYHAAASARL